MKHLITIILFLYGSIAFSQTWERIIGVPNRPEAFQNFSESYDQGFLVLGIKEFSPDLKGFVVKTDINGFPLYELTLGIDNSQMCVPVDISSTSDGGAIICGEHFTTSIGDVGVIKLNACGALEWCKTWRTDDFSDFGIEIHQLEDEGYIMLANRNTDSSHVFLFRLGSDGNPLWVEPYANLSQYPVSSPTSLDLHLNSKENYLLSGYCWWCDSTQWCRLKAMVIQVDTSSTEEWVSVFMAEDDNYYTSGNSGIQKGSGNYYIGAVNRSYGLAHDNPPMLIVTDTLGNFLRDTIVQIPHIGDYYAVSAFAELFFTPDDRLFAQTYMVNDPSDYIGHFSLHEIDSLGGWHKTFFRENAQSYRSKTILTSDGKILAGSAIGSPAIAQDIILMKLNTSLEYDSIYTVPRVYDYLCPDVSKSIDLDCDVIVDVKNIPTRKEYYRSIQQIFITPAPNPATDQVRFILENTQYHKNIRIICYDIYGRQMSTTGVYSGSIEETTDISSWPPACIRPLFMQAI